MTVSLRRDRPDARPVQVDGLAGDRSGTGSARFAGSAQFAGSLVDLRAHGFREEYVASRTLDAVEWQYSTLLEGDAGDAVARLEEEDGPEIQVHGSAGLIQTLLERDLVDEFRIRVFPLVLGTGKRLFGDGTMPAGLRLVRSDLSSTGVFMMT